MTETRGMSAFEREVIDRLARIEVHQEATKSLSESLLRVHGRADKLDERVLALEQQVRTTKDRLWGVIALATIFIPQLVSYIRVQLFGAFTPPH